MNPRYSINQFRDANRVALSSVFLKISVSADKTSRTIPMVKTVVDGKEIYAMEEHHVTAV